MSRRHCPPPKSDLGKSLIRNLNKRKGRKGNRPEHIPHNSLRSILEETDLDRVKEKDFDNQDSDEQGPQTVDEFLDIKSEKYEISPVDMSIQRSEWNSLRIPRRPDWNPGITPAELEVLELKQFHSWRKELSKLEVSDMIQLTPFEKNCQIWRQLWRVIERSNVLVHILDARDPIFYRSLDLENYILQLGNKVCVLLLNKADCLSSLQRMAWAHYFSIQGIPACFFAANAEIDETLDAQHAQPITAPVIDNNKGIAPNFDELERNSRIMTHKELCRWLEHLCEKTWPELDHWTIGMVGYPNVGKSSTINALLMRKRVAVSSTPGRTKHLQTHCLSPKLTLCDCPGLVFPSALSTRSEMVCMGLIRLAEIRECLGPLQVLAHWMPARELEYVYGLFLDTSAIRSAWNVLPTEEQNELEQHFEVALQRACEKHQSHFFRNKCNTNVALGVDSEIGITYPRKENDIKETDNSSSLDSGLSDSYEDLENQELSSSSTRDDVEAHLMEPLMIDKGGILPTKVLESKQLEYIPYKEYKAGDIIDPNALLEAYCEIRKFRLVSNQPDRFRAARCLLSDLISGRLLMCRAPPTMSPAYYRSLTKFHNPGIRRIPEIPLVQIGFRKPVNVASRRTEKPKTKPMKSKHRRSDRRRNIRLNKQGPAVTVMNQEDPKANLKQTHPRILPLVSSLS